MRAPARAGAAAARCPSASASAVEEQEEEGPVACSQECRVAASARGTAHSEAVRVMRGVRGARCMP